MKPSRGRLLWELTMLVAVGCGGKALSSAPDSRTAPAPASGGVAAMSPTVSPKPGVPAAPRGTEIPPSGAGGAAVGGAPDASEANDASGAAGVSGAGGAAAELQGDFRSLGFPEGTDSIDSPKLSADGKVVVATASLTSDYWNRLEGVKWTRDGGFQSLGLNQPGPDPTTSSASSVNGDGGVIVGDVRRFSYRSFVYRGGSAQFLTPEDSPESPTTWDVSEDGSVVVGALWSENGDDHAFRWTAETGVVKLPTHDVPGTESAYAISGDGRVVTGLSGNHLPVIWDAQGQLHVLPMPVFVEECDARGINFDGSMVVGSCTRPYEGDSTPSAATVWVSGVWHELVPQPGAVANFAYGVSGDGSVIVGTSDEAAVWIHGGPAQSIRRLLEDAGHDLTGWRLHEAVSVSKDGKVVVGRGAYEEREQLWIALLP